MRALWCLVVLACGLGRLSAGDALPLFETVGAELSGLDHKLNADPNLGRLETPYLGPLVDLNGDGHADIHWYGHTSSGAAFFWGNGKGRFQFCGEKYDTRWKFHAFSPLWWNVSGTDRLDAMSSWATQGFYVNDGSGKWTKANACGFGLFVDADGSGKYESMWMRRQGMGALNPKPDTWNGTMPEKVGWTLAWKAEDILGWPEGETRSPHPMAPAFEAAFSSDLNGDDRNELIVTFRGSGLYAWVLERDPGAEGPAGWKDTTASRGLPVGKGHYFYPEDLNADGRLDLLDLANGEAYLNDGKGSFAKAPFRAFDASKRKGGAPFDGDGRFELLDLDNDGRRDLVLTSNHTMTSGIFLNRGDRFEEWAPDFPLQRVHVAFGDVDGDRALDVVHTQGNQLVLRRNRTPNAAVQVQVRPKVTAIQQVGCKIWVYKAGTLGKPEGLLHYRQCFMDRFHTNDVVLDGKLHVGIGSEAAVDVRVRFPSGQVREAVGVAARSKVELQE
ncbi:MAG: VCBS repeat-containing protein [Planctomycetes bacterium]|nr:VCBS repeat-containing protein [Planctomycetota bacterium]